MKRVSYAAFSIDKTSRLNLQKQIQICVISGVEKGRIKPLSKLPSSRALAQHLGISRITVSHAYSELAAVGAIFSKARSGFYISDASIAHLQIPKELDRPKAQQFLPEINRDYAHFSAKIKRPQNWRDLPYCFIYGQADTSLIDHYRWRQCSLEALGRKDFDHLILDTYKEDDPLLIECLTDILLPRQGIFAKPDEILITLGAQNALWICAELLLNKQKTAAIENPCYPLLREMLTFNECKIKPIPVDSAGMRVDEIPKDTNVVFTTPSFQSPTNVKLALDRRQSLIALAQKEKFMIIEDDYEFESQANPSQFPALKSIDPKGHVIYVGSFSKSLFPGLRLGFMIASPKIISQARALRYQVLRSPSPHAQRTAGYFISMGYFDRQLKHIARVNNDRNKIMRKAIQRHNLSFANESVQGGSSFWMKTDPKINTTTLAENLLERGVFIEAGEPFFDPINAPKNFYRLGFSSVDASKIDEGISILSHSINAHKSGHIQ